MADMVCKHQHTELIAQDDNSQYVECLDCGEILEAGELDRQPAFDESLSDA
jgi:transcription initiation factor TFIIIB Brf1 subunit/transcription initiation factor TFIIB